MRQQCSRFHNTIWNSVSFRGFLTAERSSIDPGNSSSAPGRIPPVPPVGPLTGNGQMFLFTGRRGKRFSGLTSRYRRGCSSSGFWFFLFLFFLFCSFSRCFSGGWLTLVYVLHGDFNFRIAEGTSRGRKATSERNDRKKKKNKRIFFKSKIYNNLIKKG